MPVHPDEMMNEGFEKSNPTGDRIHRVRGDINPLKETDIERLRESMSWSAQKLRPFQCRHFDAVKFFAGNRYGENTGLDKSPMNLMRLAVEVWLRQLAAQTPRCLILTRVPDLKTTAFELEIATDFLLKAIRFGENLSDVVRSAIFSMGIMKVGITSPYLMEGNGFDKAVGQPYAEPILFEDWLHDMNARRREEWDWCGNRYRLPYDLVKDNPDFDPKVRDKIRPRDVADNDDITWASKSERTNQLSTEESIMREEFRESVEVWDIWIPHRRLLVTLPAQGSLKPLQVREWEGPARGPYHTLGFTNVPGNVVPAAPAQNVYDLQDVITRLFNQTTRQALRQKTLTVADGRAVEDGTAERIMEGEDGQVIRTGHIDGIKEMKYGGVDPSNQAYLVWLREIFSYMGGNIDAMGGLAQQAGTLGQEQLLVQSSSEMVRDMQSKVVTFTQDVVHDLAWYMYTDPQIELPLTKKIEGYGEIPFDWGPDARRANFFDYHFEIQPYSLQNKGPSQRLGTIMQIATQILLPLAPQMQEWGMEFNIQKFIEIVAKYSDLPELSDLISTEMPTPYEEMYMTNDSVGASSEGKRPAKPPVTQRNYTRTNVPTGGTQAARSTSMINSLMSAAKSGGGQGGK